MVLPTFDHRLRVEVASHISEANRCRVDADADGPIFTLRHVSESLGLRLAGNGLCMGDSIREKSESVL